MSSEHPKFPNLQFFEDWFDLLIKTNKHIILRTVYSHMKEHRYVILPDQRMKDKIEPFLEDARCKEYHDWDH